MGALHDVSCLSPACAGTALQVHRCRVPLVRDVRVQAHWTLHPSHLQGAVQVRATVCPSLSVLPVCCLWQWTYLRCRFCVVMHMPMPMHAFLVKSPSVILVQVHRRHLYVPVDVYPEAHWTLHSWHHSRLPRLRIEALVGSCRVAVTCSKTVLSVVTCSPAQHLGREGEFGSVQPHGVMGPSAARSHPTSLLAGGQVRAHAHRQRHCVHRLCDLEVSVKSVASPCAWEKQRLEWHWGVRAVGFPLPTPSLLMHSPPHFPSACSSAAPPPSHLQPHRCPLRRYIVTPIGRGVSAVCRFTGRTLRDAILCTFHQCLKPIGRGISRALAAIWRGVVRPVGPHSFEGECTRTLPTTHECANTSLSPRCL